MNETQVRFYLACTLAELSQNQTRRAARRLHQNPSMPTLKSLKVSTSSQGAYLSHRNLKIARTVLGDDERHLVSYDPGEFRLVWQEVFNFTVITATKAQGSIRSLYFASISEEDWRRLAWKLLELLDKLDFKVRQYLRDQFMDSIFEAKFR